jgi:phosphate-selective porin OprO/OprP
MKKTFSQLAVGIGTATLACHLPVQAAEPAAVKSGPSGYDRIWKYADLYQNDNNAVIQSLKFTGRFQLDYAHVDADQGGHDEWNIRRLRLGGKATLFRDFTAHAEVDLNPQEPYPLYQRLTDAYLSWSRSKSFVVTVGKQGAGFTMDGMTSSKELLAIDRGNLANNLWFTEEYIPGVTVSGKPGAWVYQAGVFSAGRADREFGEFNGSAFGLLTVGYDFAKPLDVKEAVLAVNYVYNDSDPENTISRQLEQIASLTFKLDAGKWGVRTDLTAGQGYGKQSDLWGGMVMPYYNFTPKLQGVLRYTYLSSDRANGVRLARYESQVVSGRGDEYSEIYAGLNYYLYKHKLKLQTGVQYATMRDQANDGGKYAGFSWTTGLRISW